jgi:hypothetical protein
VAKYGPLSAEVAQVLDREDEIERLADVGDAPVGVEGLKAMAKAKNATVETQAQQPTAEEEPAGEPDHDPETGEIREAGDGGEEPPADMPEEPPLEFGDESGGTES